MESDESAFQDINRDAFFAKIASSSQKPGHDLEIWASSEAKKNETGKPHEHREPVYESLKGIVQKIIFANEETGFSVAA